MESFEEVVNLNIVRNPEHGTWNRCGRGGGGSAHFGVCVDFGESVEIEESLVGNLKNRWREIADET